MSHRNLSTKVGGEVTQKSKPILQLGDFRSSNKAYKIVLENVSLFFKCVLNNLSKNPTMINQIFPWCLYKNQIPRTYHRKCCVEKCKENLV